MNIRYAFIGILLMALATYIPRVVPLAVFRKEIQSNYIKSFLQYIPYAVLGALTIPDIFYSTGNVKTALCGTVVAIFLAYREKSLVIVAIGAILTVYITGLFL